MSDPQELVAAYLEGWKVEEPQDCARLLLEALTFLGFQLVQGHSLPASTDEPLETHCNICGAKTGQDCRNVSLKSPPLNRRFHLERETAFMHKERTR